MLAPLKNRVLATVGLLGLLPLALGLLRGTLTVDAAGFRAAVLLGFLMVIERFVLPFRSLLVEPRRSQEPGAPDRRRSD